MAINLSDLSLASGEGAGGGGGVTSKMKFIPVTTLPDADVAKRNAVYLVPAKNPTSVNKYDEYVVLETESGYIWELFGRDVSVDLQSFATKTELAKKQDKLVNQQNIRSINNIPLVGAGNINLGVLTDAEKAKVLALINNGGGGMTDEEREQLAKVIQDLSRVAFIGEDVDTSVADIEATIPGRVAVLEETVKTLAEGGTVVMAAFEEMPEEEFKTATNLDETKLYVLI